MKRALALLWLALPALAQDQVWTWTDEKGEEHYTNDKSSIPEKVRGKARPTQGQELSVVKSHDGQSQSPPPPIEAAAPVKDPPAAFRRAQGAIRVVLFESSTNSGSKALSRAGVLDKLVSNNPGLKLERVEYATAVERAEKLSVNQLPTVLLLDQTDTIVARVSGLVTLKQLQALLDQARSAQ